MGESVGPEMRAVCRVDQLRGNAHALSGLAHRVFNDVADAHFTSDLLHVDGLAFVGEARIAGDDQKAI